MEFTAEDEYSLFVRIMIGITSLISVLGIVANILNIRTFYRLGLRDGITVSLFALSISDMFFLISYFGLRVFSLITILEEEDVVWLSIHPSVFSAHIAGVTLLASYIGMFAVTFLALARCLCVALPLRFKNIFTRSRCVAFYVSFFVIGLFGYLPVAARTLVQEAYDASKNKTRIVLKFPPDREKIKDTVWLIYDTILPIVLEATLIVCVLVMIHKLRVASRFRYSQRGPRDDNKNMEAKLNQRDRRVVIQVILISIIYIIANIPKIFNSLYNQFEPKFAITEKYQYILYMMSDVRFLCECINCTVNFFVYFKFNSAFRAACCLKGKPRLHRGSFCSSRTMTADTDLSIISR